MTRYSSIATDADPDHEEAPTEEQDTMKDTYAGQASWLSSVVNLVNTIVGSGVLAMPSAMAHMGMTLGIIVILWSGLTAGFGLYLQTRCARYIERGHASFFALSQMTYPNAAVIFDAAIAIKCFGVAISYLIIIGDLMPSVVKGFNPGAAETPFLVDRQFWITVFMLILIPLAFLRRLDSLKYTSFIALVSIAYLVIIVVGHFIRGDTVADRGPINYFRWESGVSALSRFPVIVFAYTCHQNMFSILNEIKNNSVYRTTSVIFASIGGAGSIYVLVAITGYLSFGNNVGGNIINMYHPSVSATIGRAAIVILVMFSYPLQIHPCRASVDAVLKWRPRRHHPDHRPLRGIVRKPDGSISDLKFAVITTILIVTTYIVAITVTSLESVLAYVGSTGSTSISFILPGLFYWKISAPDSPHHLALRADDDDSRHIDGSDSDTEDEAESRRRGVGMIRMIRRKAPWKKGLLRKMALALSIYGLVVMVTCLALNIFFDTN